jgi:hypothetical protein
MKKIVFGLFLHFFVVVMTGHAVAQGVAIYPAKGQSQQQMEKDKGECYSWAKGQTGFDPTQASAGSQAPPPSQPVGGERIKGAARGAAVGAVAGEVANDDAGKGAAAGAAAGAVVGGMKHRQNRREQADAQQQQSAAVAQKQNEYNKAFGACMEGRGYTVKQ